jgi:hypothetical protein
MANPAASSQRGDGSVTKLDVVQLVCKQMQVDQYRQFFVQVFPSTRHQDVTIRPVDIALEYQRIDVRQVHDFVLALSPACTAGSPEESGFVAQNAIVDREALLCRADKNQDGIVVVVPVGILVWHALS